MVHFLKWIEISSRNFPIFLKTIIAIFVSLQPALQQYLSD